MKSALVYSESSRLSPHSQSTPCVENDKIMAEVMQPPQDVAPTPNEPDFFNQIDDVIVEESADVEQQRQPTVSSKFYGYYCGHVLTLFYPLFPTKHLLRGCY